jgi:hypothetical protein
MKTRSLGIRAMGAFTLTLSLAGCAGSNNAAAPSSASVSATSVAAVWLGRRADGESA